MDKVLPSRTDLEEFTSDHLGFYGLDLSRISSIFIAQIMQIEAARVVNTFQILDEVKVLEGIKKVSSTQPATCFKKQPLKGLMKKHFIDASFIKQNLNAYFGYEYGGNRNLEDVIEKAFKNNTSGYVDDEFLNYLAHETTIGALDKRRVQKKMTGEWIVFQKYNGLNYYLTVASHRENDDEIYKRCTNAYDLDYNFLR